MGDGGGRSPAREKSATAIYSQQALDSRCLRVPFRRRGVAGNRGDGSRRPLPPLGALFPMAVMVINRPAKSWRGGTLTSDDRRFLRAGGRRTWRYFDDLCGPQTSWLRPANARGTPTRAFVTRTSPTTTGLSMLATALAYAFG